MLFVLLPNVLIPYLQFMEQLEHVPLLALLMVPIVIKLVYLDIIYQVVVYHDIVNILGFYRLQMPFVLRLFQSHAVVLISQISLPVKKSATRSIFPKLRL